MDSHTTDDSVFAQVHSILQEARINHYSVQDKLQLLTQVFEEVYSDSELLNEFYAPLLQFESEKYVDIKIFVVKTIEQVCKTKPHYLLSSVPTLLRLMHESNVDPKLIKAILLCCMSVLESAFELVLHEKLEVVTTFWLSFNQLLNKLVSLVSEPTSDAVKQYTFKLLELLTLAYSPSETKPPSSLIDRAPLNHPFLTPTILTEAANTYLTILGEKSETNLSSSCYLMLVNALHNIANSRPSLLPKAIPYLIAIQQRPPLALTNNPQLHSIQYVLRMAMLDILKLKSPVLSNWTTQFAECLVALGVKDQTVLPIRPETTTVNKRPLPDTQISNEITKRPREDNPSSAVAPLPVIPQAPPVVAFAPKIITPANILEVLLQANFTLEMITELVMESMIYPVQMQPLTAQQPISTIPLQIPVPVQTWPSVQPPTMNVPIPTAMAPPPIQARQPPRRDPRLRAEQQPEPVVDGVTTHSVPPTVTSYPVMSPPHSALPDLIPVKEEPVKEVPMVIASSQQQFAPKFGGYLGASEERVHGEKAFLRILVAEKGAELGGQSVTRNILLARLASSLEFDNPLLEELFKHILDAFSDRKELALQWLFQELASEVLHISTEIGEGRRYTKIFMRLLHNIQERLDTRDRSFTYLLLEAPELPSLVFDTIKAYCENAERMTLGLSTLRDLILYRPPYRNTALDILLEYTAHHDDSIRSPAIRLATNKLYNPAAQDPISVTIEAFAKKLLYSLQSDSPTSDEKETIRSSLDFDILDKEYVPKDGDIPEDEAKRRLFLYFSLCTKKHELLFGVVEVYIGSSMTVRRVIHQQAVGLIKAVGIDSLTLFQLITTLPSKSETLILHFLHILTDGLNKIPSNYITAVRTIYNKRVSDARFLVPILVGLDKDEIISYLPKLVVLPTNTLKGVINRLLQSAALSPTELLIALHQVDASDQTVLKKVIEAIQLCLEHKNTFKQEVLAVVLQQLIDLSPLPQLVMRTVRTSPISDTLQLMQTVTRYPKLIGFIMTLLSRLTTKQVWNDKRLWEGFVKCCKITQPHSFPVLISLPPPQFESALQIAPELKELLTQYCTTTSAPRSILSILGIK